MLSPVSVTSLGHTDAVPSSCQIALIKVTKLIVLPCLCLPGLCTTQALQRADCEAQPLLELRLESTVKYHIWHDCDKNANALFSFLQFIMIERRIYK